MEAALIEWNLNAARHEKLLNNFQRRAFHGIHAGKWKLWANEFSLINSCSQSFGFGGSNGRHPVLFWFISVAVQKQQQQGWSAEGMLASGFATVGTANSWPRSHTNVFLLSLCGQHDWMGCLWPHCPLFSSGFAFCGCKLWNDESAAWRNCWTPPLISKKS